MGTCLQAWVTAPITLAHLLPLGLLLAGLHVGWQETALPSQAWLESYLAGMGNSTTLPAKGDALPRCPWGNDGCWVVGGPH